MSDDDDDDDNGGLQSHRVDANGRYFEKKKG